MTKKELKKEAEEYLKQKLEERKDKFVFELPEVYIEDVKEAYLTSAEPREKQIEIDAEQIRALHKQNGELTDKVKELEAQIEKMKCCYNCKHSRTDYVHCITDKHENWEMIEK